MRARHEKPSGALILLLVLPSCVVTTDDPDEPLYRGTLVVDWTIDGSTDPYECRQSNVATIDITVETLGGSRVGGYQQDCEAFATSIDLWPGDYAAYAVLLDPEDYERTTFVDIDPFTIYGDDVVHVPIDFPPRSFY